MLGFNGYVLGSHGTVEIHGAVGTMAGMIRGPRHVSGQRASRTVVDSLDDGISVDVPALPCLIWLS